MQIEAAGRITTGAYLSGYEAVRFKKPQKKLAGGSWTSLQKLQVLLPKDSDASTAQQSIDRAVAMAKGTIVARCASTCVCATPAGMLLLHIF